jgi:hypothetical protein
MSEQETIGWRQVLTSVNLHDFADMVRGEGIMIGTMLRRAFAALPRLPFGPLVFFIYLLLAWLRAFLLFAVVIFFGSAIALISVIRGLTHRSEETP